MDFLKSDQTEFDSQAFKKVVLQHGNVTGVVFLSCSFTRCSFKETTFQACTFRECLFQDCDLSLARLPDCSFSATRFEHCQLIGVNWAETELAKRKFPYGKPVDFTGCVLNYATFLGLALEGVAFTNCIAYEVSFEGADLTRADCKGTDFLNSRFVHTNLTEADFRGASNYTIAPPLNTLKKTKFSLPEAMALLYGLDIVLDEGA